MKKLSKKLLILLPVFSLTACGYSLKELYDGDAYNSTEFAENYYREWDTEINYHNENSQIINKAEEAYELTSVDHVFTKYNCDAFYFLENDHDKYAYEYDKESHLNDYKETHPDDTRECYGPSFNLSSYEKSFRYGYVSKLFDGQMFCNGNYEAARVQIDETGFGRKFTKEYSSGSANYFAINFKGAVEFRRGGETINIPSHYSNIKLTINFFCKNDTGYTRVPVTYTLDVPTNTSDHMRESEYTFFGFELNNNVNIDRCAGFSVEYELISDTTLDEFNEKAEYATNPLKHSLLIYEVLMPGSIWH